MSAPDMPLKRNTINAMRPRTGGAVATHVVATVLAVFLASPVHADPVLSPQTKLKVSVVQWMPAKGEYQQWGAVSGDYTVSDEGTITLPLVGKMEVAGLTNADIASKISAQLKDKTGLINLPDATVDVLEYPPVYVVGVVSKPGEYKFRPGLTVLQALALSGGRQRLTPEGGAKGEVGMLGDLQIVRDDIIRSLGRIARLQAEASGDKEINFPGEMASSPNKKTVAEVMAQERAIFEARKNGLSRQLENLSELRDLFAAEVSNLGKKTEALDKTIKSAVDELTNVTALYEKGIATTSRKSDLERAVAGLQAGRLDEVTQTMRARQNLSEATRNALGLRDQRIIDVSLELHDAQAKLQDLKVREDVLVKTLVLSAGSGSESARKKQESEPNLAYAIVRRAHDKVDEFPAEETTELLPGDVVKVFLRDPQAQAAAMASSAAPSQ